MLIKKLKKAVKKGLVRTRIIDPFRSVFKEIEFETTTYCNRRCSYCPQSKSPRLGNEGGRYMPQSIFEKLIADLKQMGFKGKIAPHLYGEPMSDPRLLDWIKYIKQELPDCCLRLVTNGDYLTREKHDVFVEAGVDVFNISKHAEQLSPGAQDLMDGLTDKERAKKVILLDYFKDYQEGQKLLTSRGGDIELTKEKRHPEYCLYVTYPVIDTFGNLILCCNDYYGQVISGNIMERDLGRIWFDPKNIRIRRRIYEGHFDLKICQNCWV